MYDNEDLNSWLSADCAHVFRKNSKKEILTLKQNLIPILIYIHSLWIFFALSIVNTFNPYFFDVTCKFYVNIFSLFSLNIIPIVCVFFLVIGRFYQYIFEYNVSGAYSKPRKVIKIENVTYEQCMSYLTSNIIPLLSIGSASFKEISLTFLIIFITGAVFIKTDMYCINPTLVLLGYKTYRICRDEDKKQDEEIIVISRESLKLNDNIKVRNIKNNIYIGRCEQ